MSVAEYRGRYVQYCSLKVCANEGETFGGTIRPHKRTVNTQFTLSDREQMVCQLKARVDLRMQ